MSTIRMMSITAAVAQREHRINSRRRRQTGDDQSMDNLHTFCDECKNLCALYLKVSVIFLIMIPTLFIAASTGNIIVVFVVFAVIVFIIWICLYWRRMFQTLDDINRQSTDNSDTSVNIRADNNVNSPHVRHQRDVSFNSVNDLPPKYEFPPKYEHIYTIDV